MCHICVYVCTWILSNFQELYTCFWEFTLTQLHTTFNWLSDVTLHITHSLSAWRDITNIQQDLTDVCVSSQWQAVGWTKMRYLFVKEWPFPSFTAFRWDHVFPETPSSRQLQYLANTHTKTCARIYTHTLVASSMLLLALPCRCENSKDEKALWVVRLQ